MSSEAPPPLGDFVAFAKKKKKGHVLLWPKSGKPPLQVWFDVKQIPGEGAKGEFHFQDRVLFLEGDGFGPEHVKGLQKTLKEDGWFTVHVALDGDYVEIDGSEFDEVTDEWAAMKKVLDRHPMSIPVRKRYDRIEALIKQTPPKVNDIRKALRVLDPEVARLKTSRGKDGQTAEVGEYRINDASKIAKIRTAWARLERQVRSTPMTRKVREDLALMEAQIASPSPDEQALTATFQRLQDFVSLSNGTALKGKAPAGDATAKAVRQILAAWQGEIAPDLAKIIAFRVKARGEGAPEATKLMALAKKLPVLLQGEDPDLVKAKQTLAFFAKARAEMAAGSKG